MVGLANQPALRGTATPAAYYSSRQSSWSRADYNPSRVTGGRTLPTDTVFPISWPPRPEGRALPPPPRGDPPAVP
eukprot:10729004-Heterocapsa_arctica.AAC.1